MRKQLKRGWEKFGGSIAVSLLLHALLAVVLVVAVSVPEMDPVTPEEVVEVTLVPPPVEDAVPEEEATEEEVAEEPPPEEAVAEEPAAEEPPADEASAEEASPEEPTPEEVAALEELQPEEPMPAPEPPVDAETGAEEGVPFSVLRPVFQFGERDSGPEVAPDGNASEAERPVEEPVETAPPAAETAPALPLPEDLALPEAAESLALPEMLPEPGALQALAELPLDEAASEQEAPEAPAEPQAVPPVELSEVRELFSTVLSDSPAAMTAMGSMPRALRGSELCTTELREQLRNAPTRYVLELLPAYKLESGNQLDVRDAAFKANGQWFNVAFRCTVDDDALRVEGFALTIGDAIPRSQWQARGFPAN